MRIETLDYWYTRWFVVRYSWSDWWNWLIGATWQETVGRLIVGVFVGCVLFAMAVKAGWFRKGK